MGRGIVGVSWVVSPAPNGSPVIQGVGSWCPAGFVWPGLSMYGPHQSCRDPVIGTSPPRVCSRKSRTAVWTMKCAMANRSTSFSHKKNKVFNNPTLVTHCCPNGQPAWHVPSDDAYLKSQQKLEVHHRTYEACMKSCGAYPHIRSSNVLSENNALE